MKEAFEVLGKVVFVILLVLLLWPIVWLPISLLLWWAWNIIEDVFGAPDMGYWQIYIVSLAISLMVKQIGSTSSEGK